MPTYLEVPNYYLFFLSVSESLEDEADEEDDNSSEEEEESSEEEVELSELTSCF